jgi:chemotaxis protein MotB
MPRFERRRRRAQADVPGSGHDRWLVSYADFVTLLFAVFVVLFAFSWHSKQAIQTVSTAIHSGFQSLSATSAETGTATVLAEQESASSPSNLQAARVDTEALNKELRGVLGESISKHEIVMQQTTEGLIISLRELGFFNSGEAKLLPGAAEKLEDTARVLRQHGMEVRVEGHSDDQPIHTAEFHSNWELSTARAMSVLTLLVDEAGFPPEKVSVAGYGAYRPVADDATVEGRRMNRRVDLVIIAPRTKEQPLH